MKKKLLALILVIVTMMALAVPALAAHPNCTEYSNDVATVRGWGGLYGLDINDINAEIQQWEFAKMLTNIFGNRISISGWNGNYTVTQQEATQLLTQVSRQLGQEVTFTGGDRNGRLKKGQACHFVCSYVDTSPKAQQAISGYHGDNNPRPNSPFCDVSHNDWYYQSTCWATSTGICNGKGNNQFCPADTCTIAEFLMMVWRAKGSPTGYGSSCPYSVEESSWAYNALCWAGNRGMVIDGSIDPYTTPCTRASAVQFVWIAAGKPSGSNQYFRDVPSGASFRSAVNWASAQGIMNGSGNNQFNPYSTITRAEAVTVLYRWLG